MRHRTRALRASLSLSLALSPLWVACDASSGQPDTTPPSAPAKVDPPRGEPDLARLREHIAFFADDAQGGRPPGGDADLRVQEHIANAMRACGLQPAGAQEFRQPFRVSDGVRLREGTTSALRAGENEIPHQLVPFGHDTGSEPVRAKLVYVGDGVAPNAKAVKGSIVVAKAGAEDPHTPVAKQRPQSKLIAARDLGAVGFILWDPDRQEFPNHGPMHDSEVPAVFVGKAGTEALLAAFGGSTQSEPRRGRRSRAAALLSTPIEEVELETANVMGRLTGNGTGKTIIIGAHMDHLGMGTGTSLAPDAHEVHNGADDNASGVAVVLEMARLMAETPVRDRPHDLLFVAFGAEEMGLLGSKHMIESMPAEETSSILAMLNFDMVGRMREKLTLSGHGTATEMPEIVAAATGELGVTTVDDGWGPSDHSTFYGAKIPVLHFFTGSHEDYHKPSDDIEKIDFEGAAAIGSMALRVVEGLMTHEALTYVEVEKPKRSKGGFRVSLGTIPDYSADVDGLRLDGVRKGGPAEAAGLAKGDVIIRIGERPVHNINDYMAAFGEMQPGEVIEFEIQREGATQVVEVVPAAPH